MQLTERRQTVEKLAGPILDRIGAFLIDAQVRRERGALLVQLFADTDVGISIDECAVISRELNRLLEADPAFAGSYRLEVSSPGLSQPLKLLRQFPKNIGRRFVLRYRQGEEVREAEGRLASVEGDRLVFTNDSGESVALSFGDLLHCRERLPW